MNIFLVGAVTVADEKQLAKYKTYMELIQNVKGLETFTNPDKIWEYREKCLKLHKDKTKFEIDHMMTDYDLSMVKQSDVMVCDISMQSIGLGIELGVASMYDKKMIFCYEKGSYVSSMITGTFHKATFIEYESIEDLKEKLSKILKILLKNTRKVKTF